MNRFQSNIDTKNTAKSNMQGFCQAGVQASAKKTSISSIAARVVLGASVATCAWLNALEFGQMGNISAGMGGAGVALKNSQWAIYYNPALLAVNKKSGFAYSFGVGYKETNLTRATSIDMDNLESMPDKIDGLFKNPTTRTTRAVRAPGARATDLGVSGVFGDVLGNMGSAGGIKTDDDLKKYLEEVGNKSGIVVDTNKTPDQIMQDIQNDPKGDAALESIKKDMQDAIVKTEQNDPNADLGFLGAIVGGLTTENLGGLLEAVGKGGSVELKDLLKSGITLSTGSDASLNRFIQDVETINAIINNNDLSVVSQNGLVMNFGSKKKRGTISFAIMPSAFASMNARIDSTHNKIIIDTGSGDYAEVGIGDGRIVIGASDKAGFDSGSIMSDQAKHELRASSVAIAEVPIGYGHLFETKIGNFAVGLAGKYIFGTGYMIEKQTGFSGMSDITNSLMPKQSDIFMTHTFGLDVGFLYSPRGLSSFNIGLVAKNLNAPKIKTNTRNVVLNTQVRAGLSYSMWKERVTIAADVDLLPNDTLSLSRPKSQMIGGGVLVDFKYVDFRLGSMYDFRNNGDEGMILTAGLNILGFLDVAVQSNLHLSSQYEGISVPSYLNIKVGGGFSW
ncbi:hypothetical protein BKN38_04735 [Helicobacter sp. CLO-3]|uniref:conjugal transfer protein TraF n=1 Tax=unclassified Helicobacter TaxID=2593540 RepID=UPI000804978E|nr:MULTISPECIES: conjugal transfer protein TraF [unclassified Helicobacter]OBV29244.1 hypothetical protein BA723_06415 [Helicobacter sp. CLO-3]OHU83896.1 hypothetical protein BKN38_04735 [Helicobacter sp. CLO-3]